ncbi:MAG: hypothetical protein ACN6RK_14645 [Stenotrophomonas sp.]
MASLIDTFQVSIAKTHEEATAKAAAMNPGGLQERRLANQADKKAVDAKKDAASGYDLIGAAMSQGYVGALDNAWEEDRVQKWTPGWTMPDDIQDRLENEGIPVEQWPLLERASSDDHLDFLIGVARQNAADADMQSQFGILANMGASLLDPVGASIDFASGGLGYAARASRLANMARSGTVAAASAAALTTASSRYNPEIDAQEIATAAAMSFALGGALGARKGAEYVKPNRILELADKPLTTGSSQSLGAARIDGLADDALPGLERRTLTEFEEQHVATGVDGAGIKPAFAPVRISLSAQMGKLKSATGRGVGRWLFRDGVGYSDKSLVVGESAGEYAKRNALSMEVRMHNAHRTGWAEFRKENSISAWDFKAKDAFEHRVANTLRGMKDDNPTVNRVAAEYREVLKEAAKLKQRNGLLDEDAAVENYLPQVHSAQAYSKYLGEGGLQEENLVELYRDSILSQMRKEATATPDGAANLAKFEEMEQLYANSSAAAKRLQEKGDELLATKGDLQAALKDAEAHLDDMRKLTGKRGETRVRAAERKVDTLNRRLQRNEERLRGIKEKHESAKIKEADRAHARTQAKAVADDGGVDADLADAMARAIVNRGKRSLVGGGEGGAIRGMDLGDLEALKEMLADAGVSAEKTTHLMSKYQQRIGDASAIGSSKRRIRLDYEHRASFTNRFGQQVELGITDLLDNGASGLVSRHVREASGWSALAARGNVRNPAELKRLRELMETEAVKAGDDVEKTLRMFDVGISNIFGRSTETNPNSWWSRASRALRDHQFIRVMNQVGFTLFTELGPAVAHGGFQNVVNSVGELGNMLRRGSDGRLTNSEARWIEELFSPGTEFLLHQPFMRHADDAMLAPVYGSSKIGIFMENLTQQAQRITSIASGMAPLNTALQRIGGRAVLMRLMDLSKQVALPDALKLRLRANGLDEAAQAELFGYLRSFKSIKELAEADMPWEMRERLSAYLYRVSRQAVLEGDASDSILLMHGPTGKLLIQFRTFMAFSYERHFLNSLYHYRDWNTYSMVMLSTTIASMQWAARTYINTADDPEKRKKLMTRENMVKAGIAQSSWGGVMPVLVDTAMNLGGEDAVFAATRSTGLSNNLFSGVPVVGFAGDLAKAASIPGQALNPNREVTAKELESAAKLVWFQNMTGWQNLQREILRAGVEHGYIPEKSEVEATAREEQKQQDKHSWGAKSLFGIGAD